LAAHQAAEEAKKAKKEVEDDSKEESDTDEESDEDSIKQELSEDEAGDSDSEASVKAESAKGTQDSPIELDCQYPTIPPYHDHTAVPRFTVPATPPSFAPHGSLPRSQHHFHQFLANHDRFENAGLEEDSLFVTQSSAQWMDVVAPRTYGYHHRTAPGHDFSSTAQFFW